MKLIKKVLMVVGMLFALQQVSHAQNWGFSLPFGAGGFAINGKNWTAGLNGIVAGGGQRGWGFGLPNGAGFYNGSMNGGCGGRGYASGGGGYAAVPGCAVVTRGAAFVPSQAPPGVLGGYGPAPRSRNVVRRNYPTAYTSGWVLY